MSSDARAARRRMERSGWVSDPEWEAQARARPWDGEPPSAFRKGPLAALVSRDAIRPGDLRWHISVSHPDRIPRWEEVADAAHELRPGVVFAIGIPPRSWWINVHPHVLHVYEMKDEALIAQWRFEGRGDRPT